MRPFLLSLLLLSACVVRPEGEPAERDRALAAGTHYAKPFAEREVEALGPEAPLHAFLAHAERQNGALEAAWFRWLAALEQVPQASTQPTTAMLGVEHTLDGGAALDRTALLLMSDAMRNLLWPGRLAAQGEAALAEARVAGARFVQERLRLQTAVVTAYQALALRDHEIAVMERIAAVLSVQVPSVAARVQAGQGMQMELLQAQVALDRVRADLQRMQAERPGLLAALRALCGAGPELLDVRAVLAELAPLRLAETALVESALRDNPELAMRREEVAARLAAVTAAEWERVPEFSLRGAVMGSVNQTLGVAMSLPWLRSTAIDAAVRQAEASVRGAEALRRQAGNDAVAMVLGEAALLQGLEAEHAVLVASVLPRLRQMAEVGKANWAAGGGTFGDWASALVMELEVERAVLGLRRDHAVGRARLAEALGGADGVL